MSEETILVLTLTPECREFTVNDSFVPSLENMQKVVGGLIESINVGSVLEGREIIIWVNEEGKLINLPPNFAIVKESEQALLDIVMGSVLVTSSNRESDTVGLTEEEIAYVKGLFDFTRGLTKPVSCNKLMLV